ncbi:ABC-F family ATP-binding cassette domain-containing protein [Litorilinea aerophila]|uniref:ABC-F family ATP-binding cassette domain-containing protein n=1 Tax=Litorilinea aerophila TaxID=1204385 RepID=A0A540VBH4_9CHLR|nr:ABC-F family ATP-binding cassette domain-containing protein [Litorilinea aerophila]MCC9078118.1 ABC-F family ATP-binding cassette domain-containing protein [Litorilinea aerophila]GIV77976.1 MAG: multidrug ABC transporter ATP-binding protein [Litorilinea sp.]
MNLITVENLTKHLGERLLFDGAHLQINRGDRVGLIGVNGSGKSTLLRIIAGLEPPDAGTVTIWGGVRVEYLPQEPELDERLTVLDQIFASPSESMQRLRAYQEAAQALQQRPEDPAVQARFAEITAEMERTGGWAAEANAKAVLTRLGITDFQARIGELSGGQRKRVALARALIEPADLLILDEPTNHIDAETVAWLEEYLAAFPGALLMVTHDRYFLDRVVNRIVELDRRQLVSYSGNYTRYLEERAARQQRLAEAEQKRQKLLQRELEWLRRSPMARGTKQKARKQRVEELLQIRYDRGDETVSMALAGRRLGTQVLRAQGLVKRFDGRPVVNGVDLELEPGERVGILGPNGAGKSTLLDLLAGKLEPDQGTVHWGETVRLGYYDQEGDDLDDDLRVLEFIEQEAPLIHTKDGSRVEAAQMLEWFLFPRPMQRARIGSLSGGERRRLYLLRTLVHQPNVLLLDEPTNDLDIQTLTVLEEFLDHFSGCVVVVSHDRYFLDRTVDFLVSMEDGRLGPRYPTPYETFQRLRQAATPDDRRPPEPTRPTPPPPASRQARGLSWKEQRLLEELEARIDELEQRRETLLAEMNGCGDDYLRLQALSAELETLDAELESTLEHWLALSERAEAV